MVYYPAASYAYSYTPTSSPKLLDKFKEHNWFLPASGDAIRIMYYLSKTEGDDAIFKNAKDAGKFIEPNTLLTSTEVDKDGVCYCNRIGNTNSTMKSSNGHAIRPICTF